MAPFFFLLLFFAIVSAATPPTAHNFAPFFIISQDGHVHRLVGEEIIPASLDPTTHVDSKDIIYSSEHNLSARIYFPNNTNRNQKLPLVVYFHGGAFIFENAFSLTYHAYMNTLVSHAKIIAVSVDYRRAPEDPVPAAHEDSWTALKWVASHANGRGPEDWLKTYADFQKVILSGDSAGGNIAHHMGIRQGQEKLEGINIDGICLLFPYFWGSAPIPGEPYAPEYWTTIIDELWRIARPDTSGLDDPIINPVADPKLSSLGCNRLLVFVAQLDLLRGRGLYYVTKLKESGWKGDAKVSEIMGETHVFHLLNPSSLHAIRMLKTTVDFIHGKDYP